MTMTTIRSVEGATALMTMRPVEALARGRLVPLSPLPGPVLDLKLESRGLRKLPPLMPP